MIQALTIKSYSYLMNSSYERIEQGRPYDVSLKSYDSIFIERMIAYFENLEEFERCAKLVEFKNSRFDHEKNYVRA